MRAHQILLVTAGLTLVACGDSGAPLTGPPAVGTLVVSTVSGGNDPDLDGYLLTVDGIDSLSLEAAGASQIDLPAGQHRLRLLGMAEHCSVSPNSPLDVAVRSGDTTSVAFEITCSVTGVRITTTTTGLDLDADGYRVEVDGTEGGTLPSIGSLLIPLEPGSRTIGLTGLAPNCAVDGPGSRTVTVEASEVVPSEFAVVCTAASGVIRILLQASGFSAEQGYEATVDGATPFPVPPGGPTYTGGVTAGDHVVSLRAPLHCSAETNPQSVTVTVGRLIRDTVEVAFSVNCVGPTRPRIAFVREPQPRPDGTPGPGSTDIYLANADGTEATRLTSGEHPAWSHDGRKIAFYRNTGIHVIDADGSNEKLLLGGGNLPAWSPDGTRIVLMEGSRGTQGISVMNADGSGLTRLISGDFANPGSRDAVAWPEWSPDGRRISFVRAPEYNSFEPWQIYVMDADGSDPRNLHVPNTVEVHNWSPDGRRIAWSAYLGGSQTIASVSSSGGDLRVHYQDRDHPDGVATHPDWSPDGLQLVFNRYTTTAGCEIPSCPRRIFVVSIEGGPARQLIPEVEQAPDYWDHQPAWSRATE